LENIISHHIKSTASKVTGLKTELSPGVSIEPSSFAALAKNHKSRIKRYKVV